MSPLAKRPGGARRPWVLGLVAVLLASAGVGAWRWREAEAEAARLADEQRARDRQARREEREARLREESEALIPPLVAGVHLGMPLEDARRARRMTVDPNGRGDEGLAYEEMLAGGSRAIYVFDRRDRLQRLQILSLIPVTAIPLHLQAMSEQYGAPTGIWDCPDTGGVPTRRFTWRHGATTVSDVFLIRGDQASVTLYLAPSGVIERSLRIGRCQPLRTREQIDVFPVAEAPPVADEVR